MGMRSVIVSCSKSLLVDRLGEKSVIVMNAEAFCP